MWLLWLTACAPALRIPGPIGGLGSEPIPAVARIPAPRPPRAPWVPVEPEGLDVAGAAAHFVGAGALSYEGTRYRWDCSGFVQAAHAVAGLDIQGSCVNMLERARDLDVVHRRKRPAAGDVAFFDNTYDRNSNGLLDDELSHVGVVEAVDEDGTITVVHLGSSGVARIYMNLYRPDTQRDEAGKTINSQLRRKSSGDSPRTVYLTGQLWCAFASFWKEPDALALEVPRP